MFIYFNLFLDNLIYAFLVWLLVWLAGRRLKLDITLERIRNALILGSFPQILHLLFVVWDYPRNDQFNNLINLVTFTSHFTALTSIYPNSKVTLFAVVFGHLTAVQVRRFLPF